jgi:superfamily II DNA/RNA helicase
MARPAAGKEHDVGAKRVRRTAEPTFKSCGDEALAVPWNEIDLTTETQYAMANVCHFSHATFVQAEVIPHFAQPRNSVVVEAATGSGKTLAFIIPVIERLVRLAADHYRSHRLPLRSRRVVGAILSPSRVLAQQTFIVARSVACRCTQTLRFVLCDLALQRVESIIAHLKRAARITGVVLVGTPGDVERVCCAMAGRPEPATVVTSACASDDEDEDLDGAVREYGVSRGDLVEMVMTVAPEASGDGIDSDGMDDEEKEQLRVAREKRAARRMATQEAAQHQPPSSSNAADEIATVAPNPDSPFLLIIDEADVVMKSSAMRHTVERLVSSLRHDHPKAVLDIGLFGATVSSAPQVLEFVQWAALSRPPKQITLGSNEQFVSKLTNRFVYCAASDMMQALVHMINVHPTKKHFVFFNNASALLHVRGVLAQLVEGRRPLLHTGKVFCLHEGMRDVAKFNEFSRFLRFTSAQEEADNAPKAKTVKEGKKIAANAAVKLEKATMLEGYANGTKRSGTCLHKATGAVLLCTDVAAFGLDVRDVEYVVHFEAPTTLRSYIHRIGRVARMGMRGLSTMLLPISESGQQGDAAISERMERFVEKLIAAHSIEQASIASSGAPISANIRSVVERTPELVASAKAAAIAMSSGENSWFDALTALDAVTAGAGK